MEARNALKTLRANSTTKASPIVWVSLALLEAEQGKWHQLSSHCILNYSLHAMRTV